MMIIYAQRGADVARFDRRAFQSLTEWSEQRLKLHVFVIWSGIFNIFDSFGDS